VHLMCKRLIRFGKCCGNGNRTNSRYTSLPYNQASDSYPDRLTPSGLVVFARPAGLEADGERAAAFG